MEPVSIISIITAASALLVAVLTHIKTSKCFGIYFETKEYEKIKQ